ncbi:MAG: hypothetical protein ACRDH8_03995 [Actinomycetota bacterium]
MLENNEELVQVWVPKRHLGAVYQRIAELEGQTEAAPSGQDGWSEELLKRAFEESGESMQAVLRYLADRPEKRVPARDLIAILRKIHKQPGGDHTLLAGVIGSFARKVVNWYGLQNSRGGAVLPFQHRRDKVLKSRVYIMPKHVARVIAAT